MSWDHNEGVKSIEDAHAQCWRARAASSKAAHPAKSGAGCAEELSVHVARAPLRGHQAACRAAAQAPQNVHKVRGARRRAVAGVHVDAVCAVRTF
jgi:hypothetical protein